MIVVSNELKKCLRDNDNYDVYVNHCSKVYNEVKRTDTLIFLLQRAQGVERMN